MRETTHAKVVTASKFHSRYRNHEQFPLNESFATTKSLQKFLHCSLENFYKYTDRNRLIRKCLTFENFQAAAKLCLVDKNLLQSFELTLRAIGSTTSYIPGTSFEAFQYYASLEIGSTEDLCQMFEHLVNFWQDQRYHIKELEILISSSSDENFLHILLFLMLEAKYGQDRKICYSSLLQKFSLNFLLETTRKCQGSKLSKFHLKSVNNMTAASGDNLEIQLQNLVTEMK